MNILITGGTGLIGRQLGKKLEKLGHTLFVLTRNKSKYLKDAKFPYTCTFVDWNDLASEAVYKKIQSVINLAGENVIQLWTDKVKDKILQSRIKTTRELVLIFQDSNLKSFISASSVGFYGDRKEEVLTERSSHGEGFLAEVCIQWEKEAIKMSEVSPTVRFCIMRTAMVLSKKGGALKILRRIYKMGMGAHFGDGKMWNSWVHIDDIVDMYVWAVENQKVSGIYNAASPRPVRNKEFSQILAQSLNRKALLAVPKFVILKMLGDMSELLLTSQRVEPTKALDEGFSFKYPSLKDALKNVGQN